METWMAGALAVLLKPVFLLGFALFVALLHWLVFKLLPDGWLKKQLLKKR